jgi:catechol 2,3-dioxygenase-like lactoylglutathione lyase family enzyme
MFSHLTIGTNNLERATAFYDAVLAPLGIERVPSKYEKWAAWQRAGEAPKLWVGFPYNGLPASWGNGWMAAFTAPTRAAVDAAYAAAMANGGRPQIDTELRAHARGRGDGPVRRADASFRYTQPEFQARAELVCPSRSFRSIIQPT